MRWERLFDDLEAQAAEAEQASLGPEVADRTRREVARVRLTDRFRPAIGRHVTIAVKGLGPLAGTVQAAGPDWLLLSERTGSETLVPVTAVVSVVGLGTQASVPGAEGAVGARLGLAYALRGIARDRSEVAATLTDGSTLTGTVDRVGADFVDITEHAGPEDRRPVDPRATRTVPLSALGALRRAV
ncbi:MAG: hypothetical protein ACRDVN_12585 [Jiangellaceae bacterium]